MQERGLISNKGDMLEYSLDLYRSLYDNIPIGIFRTTPEGNFLYVNPSLVRMLGYTSAEVLLNVPVVEVYADPAQREQLLAILRANHTAADFEVQFKRADGTCFWGALDVRAVIVEGKIIHLDGILTDISDRKKSQEELAESEERYRLLADTAQDVIIIHGMDGRLRYVNQRGLDMSGYEETEVLGMSITDFIPADQQPLLDERHSKRIAGDTDRYLYETCFVDKKGRTIPVEVGSSLMLENGEPSAVFIIARDISKRKMTEEALRQSEERYRVFAEESLIGVYIYGRKENRFLYVNKAMAEIFGRAREELLKCSPWDFVLEEDKQGVLHREKLPETELSRSYEMRIRRKNGDIAVVEVKSHKITYQGIEVFLGNCIDVTQRKQATEKEREYTANQEFLSQTAMEFVRLPYEQDLYEFIGERLKIIVGDAVIAVMSYDAEKDAFVASYVSGLGDRVNEITELLKVPPMGMVAPVTEPVMEILLKGTLEKLPSRNISALTDGVIPKSAGKLIENILGIGDIYVKGFNWEGKLFGSAVIVMTKEKQLLNRNVVEIFTNQASVALQRRQAEQALRQSERLQRALFTGAADPIIITDLTDRTLAANVAFERLFGYQTGEIIGRSFPGHKGIDDGKFLEWVELCRSGEGISGYETIRRAKDGGLIPVSISVSPILDEKGELMALSFWYRDITARKRAEDALRESDEFNRAVIAKSPLGVSVRSPTGRLLSVNQAWRDIWGMPDDEIERDLQRDRTVLQFDDKDSYLGEWQKKIRDIYENGGYLYIPELVVSNPRGGGAQWISHYFYAIKNSKGEVDHVVILTQDITDRKKTEEVLKRERAAFSIIAEAAVGEEDLQSLCHRVLTGLVRTLGFDTGSIQFYDEEDNVLKLASMTGFWADKPPDEYITIEGLDDPRYVASYVARNRKPVFAPDVSRHEIFETYRQRFAESGISALISWPILSIDRKLLGVIHLASREPRQIPAQDRTFFEAVVDMFANVLERKRAEEALRESQERYRALTEEALVGVYMYSNSKRRYLFVNPAMADITGYSQEELLAIDPNILSIDADRHILQGREKIIERGDQPEPEYVIRIKRKDKKVRVLLVRTHRIQYEGEEVALGNCIDITDQVRQQNQIENAKQEWERTFDATSDLVMIVDTEQNIVRANKAVSTYTGWDFHELLTKSFHEVFHLDADVSADGAVESCVTSKQPQYSELFDPANKRAFSVSLSPLFDRDGNMLGTVNVARDITEVLEMEEALAASESQFRGLAESAGDIIFRISLDGTIDYVNPAVQVILGFRTSDIIGKKFADIPFLAAQAGQVANEVVGSVTKDVLIPLVEIEQEDAQGRKHILEGSSRRLSDSIIGIIRDVTERKRMERQLLRTSKLASIGVLAAGIAHQVNNPLAIMVLTTTALRNLFAAQDDLPPSLNEKTQKFLGTLDKQIERTRRVVSGLLAFTQEKRPKITATDVNSTVEEALQFLSQPLAKETLDVQVNLGQNLPKVSADGVALQQVVVNVIQNALGAMNEEGKLVIGTEKTSSGVRILVSDTGPGIPTYLREEIFEPLFSTKSADEGTGLGLSVSVMLLERFGGRIYIEDTSSRGTTFAVELPAWKKEES